AAQLATLAAYEVPIAQAGIARERLAAGRLGHVDAERQNRRVTQGVLAADEGVDPALQAIGHASEVRGDARRRRGLGVDVRIAERPGAHGVGLLTDDDVQLVLDVGL